MKQKTHRPLTVEMPSWGIFVLESHHADDFRMEMTRHPFWMVFYILEGTGIFETAQDQLACQQGDVVVVPSEQPYRIRDSAEPLSLYLACIETRVLTSDREMTDCLPHGRLPRGGLLGREVRGIFRGLLFEQLLARPGRGSMMMGLSLQLAALLARSKHGDSHEEPPSPPPDSDHITSVATYMRELEERFFESDSLDHVVTKLGMSRRRFTQIFRQLTGDSWLQHVRALRIRHAKRLLAETDRPPLSVAFECGYEDLSSFYRAFKQQTGTSPNRWRDQSGP